MLWQKKCSLVLLDASRHSEILEMSEEHPADHNPTFAQSYHTEELLRGIGRSHLMGLHYLSRHLYSKHDIAEPQELVYLTT